MRGLRQFMIFVLVAGGGVGAPAAASAATPGTWSSAGSMSVPREYSVAAALPDGDVLVAGGDDNTTWSSADVYDPSSGTWSPTASMSTARDFATATALPDGDVLLAGGADANYNVLASAEVYDPSSGTWTTTGSMSTVRNDATATALPGGDVLVAGGYDDTDAVASAEVYDPSSGTWTTTGSLITARAQATATALPGGDVLFAGGYDDTDVLASAQVYDAPEAAAVTLGAPGAVTATAATLGATVNPDGLATTYQFRLSPDPQFASSTTSLPATAQSVGAGTDSVAVTQPAPGLTPDSTYYLRLIATNAAGTTTSPRQQFTTAPATTSTPTATSPITNANPVTAPALRIFQIRIRDAPVRWCTGCRYPSTQLRFTLTAPTTIRLLLLAYTHTGWRQVAIALLHGHTGPDRFRLAGRWHGQLIPARQLRVGVQTHTSTGWRTHAILRLRVYSTLTRHAGRRNHPGTAHHQPR